MGELIFHEILTLVDRVDEEATTIKWELITEDELNGGRSSRKTNDKNMKTETKSSSSNIGEKELFGALTDTDDDDNDPSETKDGNAVAPKETDAQKIIEDSEE